MSSSIFAAVEMAPRDPILGLNEAFNADSRSTKVNLGVGVYFDDNGKIPLLGAVRSAEKTRLEAAPPRGYQPIEGPVAYNSAVQNLLFGADSAIIRDGRVVTAQALAASGGVVQHTYADGAASHVVQVSAANEEGLFALGTQAVTVNNVAPAITVSGAASIAEGGSYTLTLGPRVDPGADTPSLYSIDWGDGTARSELSPAAYDALVAGGGQLTHVYADGASNPVITVRVTDEDGEHVARPGRRVHCLKESCGAADRTAITVQVSPGIVLRPDCSHVGRCPHFRWCSRAAVMQTTFKPGPHGL